MTQPPGAYLAPAGAAEAEIREKKSRFLALIRPAADEEAVHEELAELRRRFPDARHHCWACRLGAAPVERSSDAGEPAGTAGVPMLQVLRGANLSDVLAVVIRWFGGIKLGKGGLARAYAEATRQALVDLPTQLKVPVDELLVELPYELLGAVKRLLRPPEVELLAEDYGARVRLTLQVHRHLRSELEAALADLQVVPQAGKDA